MNKIYGISFKNFPYLRLNTRNMKNYLGIGVLLLMVACNSEPKKSNDNRDTTANSTTVTTVSDPSFKSDTVKALYQSYIQLKDALVATKFDDAKLKAKALGAELKSHNGCESTAMIASKIENANDIAEQRKQFTALSTDLIALFKHAELTAGKIYIQHCPMANNGDGGDWLSSDKKIQNPYYGSEMMECGAVIEEIKTK